MGAHLGTLCHTTNCRPTINLSLCAQPVCTTCEYNLCVQPVSTTCAYNLCVQPVLQPVQPVCTTCATTCCKSCNLYNLCVQPFTTCATTCAKPCVQPFSQPVLQPVTPTDRTRSQCVQPVPPSTSCATCCGCSRRLSFVNQLRVPSYLQRRVIALRRGGCLRKFAANAGSGTKIAANAGSGTSGIPGGQCGSRHCCLARGSPSTGKRLDGETGEASVRHAIGELHYGNCP